MGTFAEVSVPNPIQGSSQDASPKVDLLGHHSHRHHQDPRGHRSAPSRFGRRLHLHHHHHHHLKGPSTLAHPHSHGDLFHGGRKHHGGPEPGLRGRHVSRGLHEGSGREHGTHHRRRMHRSLSPHHLMQNGSSDGSAGNPIEGNRGHGGHCDGNFQIIFSRKHHSHNLHSQDLNAGSDSDRPSPLPAAIEEGIEQLGQLSLRSEPGSH